jgi:ribosome recycling factor
LQVIESKAKDKKLFIIDPLDRKMVPQILSNINKAEKILSPYSVFQKAVC